MLSNTLVEPEPETVLGQMALIHGFQSRLGPSSISGGPVFMSDAVQDPFLGKVILDKSGSGVIV